MALSVDKHFFEYPEETISWGVLSMSNPSGHWIKY